MKDRLSYALEVEVTMDTRVLRLAGNIVEETELTFVLQSLSLTIVSFLRFGGRS